MAQQVQIQKLGKVITVDTSQAEVYLKDGWGLVNPKTGHAEYPDTKKEAQLKQVIALLIKKLEVKDLKAAIAEIDRLKKLANKPAGTGTKAKQRDKDKADKEAKAPSSTPAQAPNTNLGDIKEE